MFTNIGKNRAYEMRQQFEQQLRTISDQSQQEVDALLTNADTTENQKTFEGGYHSLVTWFRNYTSVTYLSLFTLLRIYLFIYLQPSKLMIIL